MFAVKLLKNKQYPLEIQEGIQLKNGDMVIVLTDKGEEAAKSYLVPPAVEEILKKKKIPSIPLIRVMTEEDMLVYQEIMEMENQGYKDCLALIKQHNLQMNLTECKYTFDKRKVTFYYTAPERVDFRELLKDLTKVFRRVRIDLKHIGVRDETSLCCGNGLCGRPFCCCTFKRQFDSINIKLAHDQSMPITPSKISGTCGRLLCCLNYEHENYIETAKEMIPIGSGVMTTEGVGRVCALNILTNSLSVKFSDGKIKEFKNNEVEMLDSDVNIDIDISSSGYKYSSLQQSDDSDNIDIKEYEDDKNSSTGNI
ncbi:MAG: stage 0 sporulation protein [Candidatus Gastranaerophilales bacterium]|nr:stage 0 sporulation protein [Candidatus Gastranaerophilales bacterium]